MIMDDADTETGTPTLWDNAWREGHAHGVARALGIPYHEGWQRTTAMLAGKGLDATSTQAQNARGERVVSAIFACGSEDCPRPFALYRHQDVTGVSGEGTVATGVQFADGQVVIRWRGETPSTVVWESLDAAMKVHGHDGRTRVVWLAAEFSEMALAEQEAAAAEREQCAQLADRLAATVPVQGGTMPFGEVLRHEPGEQS